jgi:hypothetical protein
LKKQDETTAVRDREEEAEEGPLSKLLKAQEETNSLLRKALSKQDEEEETEEDEEMEKARMKKQNEDGEPEEKVEKIGPLAGAALGALGAKVLGNKEKMAKDAGSMEQTSQGAAKKVSDKPGEWNPEEPDASKDYVSKQGEEKEPEKEEAYPYPYPEEAKAVAKAFPFPYDTIGSKREEIVAKQLFNANQEIARLSGQLAKMVSPDKVEDMVNTRFQQKMMEEGFVTSTGALPPVSQPTEIAKEDTTFEGGSELQKANEVAAGARHLSWENIIAARQETDPAYRLFLKQTPGVRMKGGM